MVEVNPGEMKPSHPFPPALSVRLSLLLLIATTTVHMGEWRGKQTPGGVAAVFVAFLTAT